MHTFARSLSVSLLALVTACGQGEESDSAPASAPAAAPDDSPQTPYGSVTEVSDYLAALRPHVDRVASLQAEYEQALASAGQSATSRRGTGRNLAEKASQVRPQLLGVLEQIDGLSPPPLLAPFHRDTRKMIAARLEAYAKTQQGWEVEKAGGDFEVVYREAEQKLQEANDLIQQLNEQVNRIGSAVQEAEAAAARAAS